MKKKIVAVMIACAMAMSFALVGCGGGASAPSPVGQWEISGMTSDGETYSAEDLQAMKDYGMNVTLSINEDGTASMNVFGEEMTGGTWDETSLTFNGQSINMTLDGDTLTLTQGDETMTFSRMAADSAEAAA